MTRMGDAAGAMNQGAGGTGQGGQGGQGGETKVIADKATQVGQDIRELGQQTREVATQKYEQLRDQAQDYYQQGRERAMEWEQSLEQYVHEKPLQAVLIAAGVGVLLGLLWKRS